MPYAPLPPWRIKLIRCLLGGVGLAIGVLLVVAGLYPQMRIHAKSAGWEPVPCRVEKWQAVISGSGGQFPTYRVLYDVRFAYERDGKTWHSETYDATRTREPDLRSYEREGVQVRSGPAVCYVNPGAPQEATFKPARLWIPYSLIGGGGLFSLLCLGFLVRTFFPGRPKTGRSRPAIFWVFTAFGLALVGLTVNFAMKMGTVDLLWGLWIRGDLVETTARVEGTDLSQTRGSGRNSHRITHHGKMAYSYEFQGRRWHADRWAFHQPVYSSADEKAVRALLASYSIGQTLRCWVHPQRPWLATLNPAFSWWDFLWQLFPLAFAVGALVCFRVARNG